MNLKAKKMKFQINKNEVVGIQNWSYKQTKINLYVKKMNFQAKQKWN